jgi:hypothetical protein
MTGFQAQFRKDKQVVRWFMQKHYTNERPLDRHLAEMEFVMMGGGWPFGKKGRARISQSMLPLINAEIERRGLSTLRSMEKEACLAL